MTSLKMKLQNTILSEIKILQHELDIQERYYEHINMKSGIPYKILKQSCNDIENNVNDILGEITDFKISLGFNLTKFDILINDVKNNWIISAEQGSGFQKFIIDISIR